jgi:hypothetical protein
VEKLMRRVASLMALSIEQDRLEIRTHPLRWFQITVAVFVVAGLAPLFGGIWPVVTVVCGIVGLSRLAILVHLRLSGRRRAQGGKSGKDED